MKNITALIITALLFLNVANIEVRAQQTSNLEDRYLTLVYPIRSRELWRDRDLSQLKPIFDSLSKNKLSSTWLFQYDALVDTDLTEKISKECPVCEKGLFLEVSEDLATDASVSYILGSGDWARPDKAFLSGYRISDREKLIDQTFKIFKEKFGSFPRSVGVWYLDPYSVNYLKEKYNIISYLSVADQYNTDGQRYWGKYFGFPFYPQKYDILAPANSLKNKSSVVELQWAQRGASGSYGNGIRFSQHSLQANDYHGIGEGTAYFEKLISQYLFNPKNSYGQITVGLEVGQELFVEEPEHLVQLSILGDLKKDQKLTPLTMSEFGQWYQKKFPDLSPVTFLEDEMVKWISTPCYRVGLLKKNPPEIFDLRVYKNKPSPDYLTNDSGHFLLREIPEMVETIRSSTSLKLDSDVSTVAESAFSTHKMSFNFASSCGNDLSEVQDSQENIQGKRLKERIENVLSIVKFSKLDGNLIVGLLVGKEKLAGFWKSKGVGIFDFPFQSLSKFKTISIP